MSVEHPRDAIEGSGRQGEPRELGTGRGIDLAALADQNTYVRRALDEVRDRYKTLLFRGAERDSVDDLQRGAYLGALSVLDQVVATAALTDTASARIAVVDYLDAAYGDRDGPRPSDAKAAYRRAYARACETGLPEDWQVCRDAAGAWMRALGLAH